MLRTFKEFEQYEDKILNYNETVKYYKTLSIDTYSIKFM